MGSIVLHPGTELSIILRARGIRERFMIDNDARQQFNRAIRAEILRRLREKSFYMDKNEIEEIGEQEGIPKEEAAQEFLRLAGRVWAGQGGPNYR
jgi:hypothetical protein